MMLTPCEICAGLAKEQAEKSETPVNLIIGAAATRRLIIMGTVEQDGGVIPATHWALCDKHYVLVLRQLLANEEKPDAISH